MCAYVFLFLPALFACVIRAWKRERHNPQWSEWKPVPTVLNDDKRRKNKDKRKKKGSLYSFVHFVLATPVPCPAKNKIYHGSHIPVFI